MKAEDLSQLRHDLRSLATKLDAAADENLFQDGDVARERKLLQNIEQDFKDVGRRFSAHVQSRLKATADGGMSGH